VAEVAASLGRSEHATRFRTSITTGVAIRRVLLHDPAGNLVELFEPAAGYHERTRQPAS
jgi:hypothetical protein